MQNRRKFLMVLATGFVALALVGSAIAEELIGYISKVDVDGKKVTVVDKDDKETEVKITDDTEIVNQKKETSKIDLEKVSKQVEKAKEKNKKGMYVTVTHEKGTASKIEQKAGKKKAATNNNN